MPSISASPESPQNARRGGAKNRPRKSGADTPTTTTSATEADGVVAERKRNKQKPKRRISQGIESTKEGLDTGGDNISTSGTSANPATADNKINPTGDNNEITTYRTVATSPILLPPISPLHRRTQTLPYKPVGSLGRSRAGGTAQGSGGASRPRGQYAQGGKEEPDILSPQVLDKIAAVGLGRARRGVEAGTRNLQALGSIGTVGEQRPSERHGRQFVLGRESSTYNEGAGFIQQSDYTNTPQGTGYSSYPVHPRVPGYPHPHTQQLSFNYHNSTTTQDPFYQFHQEYQPTFVNMLSPSKPRITSQSAEFASRFSHAANRPSTRPKVIGLDSETMIPRGKCSKTVSKGSGGFFPPVKIRVGGGGEHILPPGHGLRKSPALLLELNNEHQRTSGTSPDHWSTRTAPPGLAARHPSTRAHHPSHHQHHQHGNSSSSSSSRGPAPADVAPKRYPDVPANILAAGDGDLANLPRPHLLVSRDTPWVYRYKVKKNMNELSKIMASKTPPASSATSTVAGGGAGGPGGDTNEYPGGLIH